MGSEVCIVYGVVISIAVSLLKKIPFVKKSPKIVAAILSAALTIGGIFVGGVTYETIGAIVKCVIEQLAISVASYEVITKSVAKSFGSKPLS